MKTLPLSLRACAAFAAGLAATLLWPAAPDSPAARSGRLSSDSSPLSNNGAAGGPSGPTRLARLAAGRKRAAGLSAAEARAALEVLPRPPREADREWWSALLTRWAEEEPAGALAWLRDENDALPVAFELALPALTVAARRDLRLAFTTAVEWRAMDNKSLFRAAAAVNPRAAVEFAAAAGPDAAQGLTAAFSEWMRMDSAAAVEWLGGRGKNGIGSLMAYMIDDLRDLPPEVFGKMLAAVPPEERDRVRDMKTESDGRADPLAMMARLPELKDRERHAALQGTVAGLARLGDAESLGRLMASLSEDERVFAGAALANTANIPPEAVKAVTGMAELTFSERLLLFSRTSGYLGPEEFLAGLKDLGPVDSAQTQEMDQIIRGRWEGWITTGGKESLALFGRMLREGRVDAALPMELISAFARNRRPEAARSLLESLPEERRAVPRALHTAFQSLLDPAVDAASPLQDAGLSLEERRGIFSSLFGAGRRGDPDRNAREISFLGRLPEGLRAEALAQALRVPYQDKTVYEPVLRELAAATDAARWTPDLTECLVQFAGMDAARDPAAGFARAETAPAGPVREKVERHVFDQVLEGNAVAASEWLARQPEGARRDELAAELVRRIQSGDPASAWQWAASIRTDPDLRQGLQDRILPIWRAADPEAAASAAESASP